MKMEIQNKKTTDKDFSTRLSDEAHQHLTIIERPSSSCRRVWVRSRPRLEATKSFPPYNQCIGGLGEDGEQDSEISYQQYLTYDETMKGDRHAVDEAAERKDVELTPRCTREDVKVKWRMMRKERLWGSYEIDPDGCERGRWSGKRRVEESGRELCKLVDKGREGGTNIEWKHCRSQNSSFETERKEEDDEQRQKSPVAAVEIECDESGGTFEWKDEEADEPSLSGVREGSTIDQRPSSHPILSKLFHSSSTSSCSSINLSSPESDEVFSEEEGGSKKRKTLRKVRMTQNSDLILASSIFIAVIIAVIIAVHLAAQVFHGRLKTIFLNCSLHLWLWSFAWA